jgi:hypothetical protein
LCVYIEGYCLSEYALDSDEKYLSPPPPTGEVTCLKSD